MLGFGSSHVPLRSVKLSPQVLGFRSGTSDRSARFAVKELNLSFHNMGI